MKVAILLSAGAFAAFGAAQDLGSLSECTRGCLERMMSLAPQLGCRADDVACLCSNMDFAYGVRDCTIQACGGQDLAAAMAIAQQVCPSGSPSGSPSATGSPTSEHTGSPTGSPSPTDSTTTDTAPPVSTPYTTQAIVSTITSGSEVITTTIGSTTLYSPVSNTTGTTGTTGTQSQETGSSSRTDNPNSTGGSNPTGTGTGTGTGTSPSSTPNGAFQTLAPATQGIMGALGVVALLAL
ncbi:hypothetical protein GX50_00711 [[Emmonsia] crescens]|uniref:CFEM domain-containing protein n=1 Tax=[Emmonsia] crescens TaxID=73230 RepID=A0A2B7ZQT9_9EURO|nr:hypothetical protein GX50_00711 [Emmonsia crescens]